MCDQLRYSGVVEAIEISRAAFPNRMQRLQCAERFNMLVVGSISTGSTGAAATATTTAMDDDLMKALVSALLEVVESPTTFVVGKTNVYFANGMLERLESRREAYMIGRAIVLQACVRRHLCERKYKRVRASIVLQKHVRRSLHQSMYKSIQNGT